MSFGRVRLSIPLHYQTLLNFTNSVITLKRLLITLNAIAEHIRVISQVTEFVPTSCNFVFWCKNKN